MLSHEDLIRFASELARMPSTKRRCFPLALAALALPLIYACKDSKLFLFLEFCKGEVFHLGSVKASEIASIGCYRCSMVPRLSEPSSFWP